MMVKSDSFFGDTISLNFFEPGHSFMSADATHAKIEKVFSRKRGSVYVFRDLAQCMQEAGCEVIQLQYTDFTDWPSGVSQYQMAKMIDRPYIKDIVSVEFRKGHESLFMKSSHVQNVIKKCDF